MPQTWTPSPWVKANRKEAHQALDHPGLESVPILEAALEPIVLSAAGAADLDFIALGEGQPGGGSPGTQAGTKTGRRLTWTSITPTLSRRQSWKPLWSPSP